MSNRQLAIKWMRHNMNVVAIFEQFAGRLIARNRYFGINLLRERVRWECIYEYGDDSYKFCNNFSPYVARYLLWKHPDWSKQMRCKQTADETNGIVLVTEDDFTLHDAGTKAPA